jgi:hypothetical protein
MYNSQQLIPEIPEFRDSINIYEIASMDPAKDTRGKEFLDFNKREVNHFLLFVILNHK